MCKDEAFKKWCFDTELVINKSWFDLENPSGDEVYIAYEAWCASASREGYKLVPVEPTQKMEMAGMNAGAGFISRSIYKAIIRAAP